MKKLNFLYDIFFFGIISLFTLSFFTYKAIEVTAMRTMNNYIKKDMMIKSLIEKGDKSYYEKLKDYASEYPKAKIYYLKNEQEIEKFVSRTYCNKKSILIVKEQEATSFQEVTNDTFYDNIDKSFDEKIGEIKSSEKIFIFHCLYPGIQVFDFTQFRLK